MHQRKFQAILSPSFTLWITSVIISLSPRSCIFPTSAFNALNNLTETLNTAGGNEGEDVSWTTWSGCSRSCGVGLSFSEPRCIKPPCKGDWRGKRRYRVCYEQTCGQDEGDLRSLQCSVFDEIPYKGSIQRWEPVSLTKLHGVSPTEACAVRCRTISDSPIVATLSDSALNGTKCSTNPLDVCLNGRCQSVGCDGVVESKNMYDVCGVCGGSGNSCRHFTGLYLPDKNRTNDSKIIAVIPPSSTNIHISEKGSGHVKLVYLEQSYATQDVFSWRLIERKHYGILHSFGGLKIEYASSSSGRTSIQIKQKIQKTLALVIETDTLPWTYIRYEYYRPHKYGWSFDESADSCSVKCGKGISFQRARCIDVEHNKFIRDDYCKSENLTPPQPLVSSCFLGVCNSRWQTEPWSICSKSCAGGIQSRGVACVTENINGDVDFVKDEKNCLFNEAKPIGTQKCNEIPCPRWTAKFWSDCSVTCGSGIQHRTVQCEDGRGGPAFHCPRHTKPRVRQSCTRTCDRESTDVIKVQPIPTPTQSAVPFKKVLTYRSENAGHVASAQVAVISTQPGWFPGPWGDCSKSCGRGVTRRQVECKMFLTFSKRLETIPDEECTVEKPVDSQPCSMGPCGEEIQLVETENLQSRGGDEDAPTELVPEESSASDKVTVQGFAAAYRFSPVLSEVQHLNLEPEEQGTVDPPMYRDYKWKYSGYGQCSPSCGFGTRRSYQYCIYKVSGVRVADDRCNPDSKKPPIVQQCSGGSCFLPIIEKEGKRIRWEISPFGGCTVGCGRGMQRRSVVCRQIPEDSEVPGQPRIVSTLPDIMCPAPKPTEARACSLAACPPEWRPGPWSECSKTCGRGIQFRVLMCMQRLATGETEPVPQDYCSRYRPIMKRRCGQFNCEPRLFTKRWSPCSRTCGKGYQTRESVCMQILANNHLAEEVPMLRCSHLPKKPLRRLCRPKKCRVDQLASTIPLADEIEIFTDDGVYVQKEEETKLKLTVGGAAYLYPQTYVIIQCPVSKSLEKSSIEWLYDGLPLTLDETHYSLTAYNNLRIREIQESDVGTYTCVAGGVEATLQLHLKNDSSTANRVSPSNEVGYDNEFDLTDDDDEENIIIQNADDDDYDDNDVYMDVVDLGNSFPLYNGFEEGTATSKSWELDHEIEAASRQNNPHILNTIERSHDALSPKPLIAQTNGRNSFITARHKEKVPYDPSHYNRASEVDGQSGYINIPLDYVAQDNTKANFGSQENYASESQFDIAASESSRRSPSITDMQDPGKELLLLLEMAGINNPSDEVFEILAKIRELDDSGQLGDGSKGTALFDMLNELEMNGQAANDPEGLPTTRSNDIYLNDPESFDNDYPINYINDGVQQVVKMEPPMLFSPDLEDLTANSPPKILVQPTLPPIQLDSDIVISVGGPLIVSNSKSVTLLCEANGSPDAEIRWEKNSEKLVPTDTVFVLPDHSLRLLNPTQADSGTYTCVASNSLGTDSVSTTLSVSRPPKILSITNEVVDYQSMRLDVMIGSIIKARLGSTVRILCNTEGHPEPYVQWRKDVSGLGDNARVLSDNSLEIRPTTAADQGLFSCEASNPVGSDYQASALLLVDPPYVSDDLRVLPELQSKVMSEVPELLMTAEELAEYRIKAGSSVIMGCPVKGFPEPEIQWFFNSRPLEEVADLLDYQLLLDDKVLQIPEVDRQTAGEFVCNASNNGGNLVTSLRLELIEYSYSLGDMTGCSATCGGDGVQHRKLLCMEDGATPVNEWYCTGLDKPQLEMTPCNRVDCSARYVADDWGPCSKTCGSGVRTRTVSCRIFMGSGESNIVDDSECEEQDSLRPHDTEKCFMEKCPFWRPGPWSKCTRKCAGRGVGLKSRRLYCVSSSGENLDRSECKKSDRPQRRDTCLNARCHPIWVASRWSTCSKSCGSDGIQTRILNCVYRGNRRQHAGTRCTKNRRPPVTSPCNRISCAEGERPQYLRPAAFCKDKSIHCQRAKMANLCSFYRHLCCETCS